METPCKRPYGKHADLSHLRIISVRACAHVKDANKLGHMSRERMVCGFSQDADNSFPYLEPQGASNCRKQERRFHPNSTALTSFSLPGGSRRYRIWKLQRLTSATAASTTTTLHAKTRYRTCKATQVLWTSMPRRHDTGRARLHKCFGLRRREDTIQDVQGYTSALDFDADDSIERVFPMQASPTSSLPVGATSQGSPSSAASVPASAPETAPAHPPALSAPPATATGTNGYVMQPGVTRAVTRSQVRSPVAIDYGANRKNRAAAAGFFQKDAFQQAHKL